MFKIQLTFKQMYYIIDYIEIDTNKEDKMKEYMADNVYLIVPQSLKEKILLELSSYDTIYNILFDDLNSFKEKYLFKIKKEAKLYLLEKYQDSLDVIDEILKKIYAVSDNKTYKTSKAIRLQKIKKELEEHNLLEYDPSFHEYLTTKKVIVMGYPFLEPYEEKMFDEVHASIYSSVKQEYPFPFCSHYETMREEITAIASQIRDLNHQGIRYDHIFLAGIDESYHYLLYTIFQKFDIPLNLNFHFSLLETTIGHNYLLDQTIIEDLDDKYKQTLLSINERLLYAKDSPYYSLLLAQELENTSFKVIKKKDAVSICEEAITIPNYLEEDDYLFVLGFNQGRIPKTYKDEEYFSDKEKQELGLLTSTEKNIKNKKITKLALTSVKHLFLSYIDTSLQSTFNPSSYISEDNIKVEEGEKAKYCYSKDYNRYMATSFLDYYYTYHEQNKDLKQIFTKEIEDSYRSYDHQFKEFSVPLKPLVFSYTNLNDYALCPFRYYVKYVLNLSEFIKTFNQKLGNIYHGVLLHMYDGNFDFEKVYQHYVDIEELDVREQFLMVKLKEELKEIIKTIKEKEESTLLTNRYLEKKIEITDSSIKIKGIIDKLFYHTVNGITYYAIVDYKTGNVKLILDYLKDGLYMQLPFYLYLVEKSKLFSNSFCSGLFYQPLLPSIKDLQDKDKNLKLFGIVSNDEESLSLLDENYQHSELIKGLSFTKQNTISSRMKTFTNQEKDMMVEMVDHKIKEFKEDILNSKFMIQPKIVNQKNISCENCPFYELCFYEANDYVYLEKEEGEEDA